MSDMNDDSRRQFTPDHAGTNDSENSQKSTLTRRHLLKMAGGALAFSLLSDLASPVDLLAADNSGKPMKIVMLTGSPHRQGTSALLADEFVAGATAKGHTVGGHDRACDSTVLLQHDSTTENRSGSHDAAAGGAEGTSHEIRHARHLRQQYGLEYGCHHGPLQGTATVPSLGGSGRGARQKRLRPQGY